MGEWKTGGINLGLNCMAIAMTVRHQFTEMME